MAKSMPLYPLGTVDTVPRVYGVFRGLRRPKTTRYRAEIADTNLRTLVTVTVIIKL